MIHTQMSHQEVSEKKIRRRKRKAKAKTRIWYKSMAHSRLCTYRFGGWGVPEVFQNGNQIVEVVAVDRANVVKAELFEEGAAGDDAARVLVHFCVDGLVEYREVTRMTSHDIRTTPREQQRDQRQAHYYYHLGSNGSNKSNKHSKEY